MRDFMGAWRALFLVGVLASTFLATSQMGTVLDVASMDTSWKREASLSLHHLLLTPTTSLIWQQNNDANAEHAALSAAAVSSTSNYYQQPRKSSRFTYAFVLGGVNPHRPAYRGLLWGVMVNVYALQRYGSTADFVLFVQLAADAVNGTDPDTFGLAPTELRVLQALRVQIRYIPAQPGGGAAQNFHDIIMNKFCILTLTEYEKVFFLDADLVLVQNLDYLFTAPFLRPNFYCATAGEPANAGFFILSPEPGDYEHALRIMARQKASTAHLTTEAKFDKVHGWGHVIEPPDYWETVRGKPFTEWSFYCAPSDQGFLYHWTKYVKKNVSIVVRNQLKNWDAYPNGTLGRLDQVLHKPFEPYTNQTLKSQWCQKLRPNERWMCLAPLRDYEHLAGTMKPWFQPLPAGALTENRTKDALHYWFYLFHEMDQQYALGVRFDQWEEERKINQNPPLGFKPHYYAPRCRGCNFQ